MRLLARPLGQMAWVVVIICVAAQIKSRIEMGRASATYLGRESAITNCALEGPLLCVAAIVDLQCGMARERLEADIAGSVASHAYVNGGEEHCRRG